MIAVGLRRTRGLPLLFALAGCSWGVHEGVRPDCKGGHLACGSHCLEPTEPCHLGMSVARSRLEGRGPGVTALVIRHVAVGSPAEAAGLRPGDAITAIDGDAPTELNLEAALAKKEKKPIAIRFLRKGYELKTEVEINYRRR